MSKVLLSLFLLMFTLNVFATSEECKIIEKMSVAEIKDHIVKASVSRYLAQGVECPCPYTIDSIGRRCLMKSAWAKSVRTGNREPDCYVNDVTMGDVVDYRYNACNTGQ